MPSVIRPVMWKKNPPKITKRQHLRCDLRHWHNRHPRLQRRVGFRVLNRVAAFMRGDAERSDRRSVVDVCRQAERLLGWIVMVAEKVIRFDDVDVMNLRCLQNFTCRFRTGNV